MLKQWPQVALGEILAERNETPDPALVRTGEIPIISKIRFSDGGIEYRTNSETNTKMILIHPGDLVLSGINAMKGAIAIYQPEMSQRAAATIHYAAYEVNKEKADIRYLWWLLRSQYFQEILSQQVPQGIKTELKAKRLLPVVIPLPSLKDQQWIVGKIVEILGRAKEILILQEQIEVSSQDLILNLHMQNSNDNKILLGDILELHEERIPISVGIPYPQVGIKAFGQGMFPREPVMGGETTYKHFNYVFEGAIVLSQVKGWEGALAVCPSQLVGYYASPEYRTFRCKPDYAIPEYLAFLFATPWFFNQLSIFAKGIGGRRNRIHPEQFLSLSVPMPNITMQDKILKVFNKLNIVKFIHAESSPIFDAFIPSIQDKAFRGDLL
ncbi:MAG: restriction endonuclease subunit S [Anaerolineaceae bacterium]|nr:restriction endonuclease subunit S [Anaerolineaceae bacterium]